MNNFKYISSIIILLFVLSCSKIPFFSSENKDGKEESLQQKEEELKQKEESLKQKELEQIEKDKQELKEEELNKKSKIKADSPPAEPIEKLILYIDRYAKSGDEASLRKAYNLWYDPLSSIGTYDKFKKGFSNTLNDEVISSDIISNDGYNAEVIVIHAANEIDNGKRQKTTYDAKYKLVNIDGVWKIRSGSADILSRESY